MAKSRKKKILAPILVLLCILVAAPIIAGAASKINGKSIVTNNIHDNDYTGRKRVANCYVVDNKNATFSRVENMGDIVLIETYNSGLTLLGQSFIGMELPVFGGFWVE